MIVLCEKNIILSMSMLIVTCVTLMVNLLTIVVYE